LWRVEVDGENRQLVASAGTVAPVARVVKAKPSPDGRSVAYAVLVPGPGGAKVDSVWVRDLGSKLGFRCPRWHPWKTSGGPTKASWFW
jgi:hypothetical protein